jgi:hypothetical protein
LTVDSKKAMYALYERGAFGGGTRHWYGAEKILSDPPVVDVIPRYSGQGGVAFPGYGKRTRPEEVPALVREWLSLGADPSLVVMGAATDDERLIIQGEVMRSERYLDLRYTRVKAPMRVALATEQKHTGGMDAVAILQASLCPASWDLLNELLDTYPDSVIEFSTWAECKHVQGGRNTIFWEVRNY